MPDLLIRNLDATTVKKLKERARRHGRSVQSEARRVLERAAGLGGAEVTHVLEKWKARLAG